MWIQLASGQPLCCSARAEWVGEWGVYWTSQQQRAAGVIILPNAPCLPPVCPLSAPALVSGRLSALMQKVTWVIKCSSQGWGQQRMPLFTGPLFIQSSSGGAFLLLIQQGSACQVTGGYELCNRLMISLDSNMVQAKNKNRVGGCCLSIVCFLEVLIH